MNMVGTLLTPDERIKCEKIASSEEEPHSQRAAALLALDEGTTQVQASERSGLTRGQVKYWLGKFRSQRLTIFPEELLEPEPAEAETPAAVPMDDRAAEPDQEVLKAAPVPEAEESLEKPAEVPKADPEPKVAKERPDEKDKKKKKKEKKPDGKKSKASKKGKKSKKSSKDNKEPVKPKKKKKSKKKKKAKKPKESKKAKGKKKPSKKKKGSQKKKKSKKK